MPSIQDRFRSLWYGRYGRRARIAATLNLTAEQVTALIADPNADVPDPGSSGSVGSGSEPISLGDLGATVTADLDGAANVSFEGVLTADCVLTIDGLSAGCHFEVWTVQDPITGGWDLSIVGGDMEDPVPVTVASDVNGVTRIGGYSPDGTALYLDLASTGGGGGGGAVVVTEVDDATLGPGVTLGGNNLATTASYEVQDDYLRLKGSITIGGVGFLDSWIPAFKLPADCKPEGASDLSSSAINGGGWYRLPVADIGDGSQEMGAYIQWNPVGVGDHSGEDPPISTVQLWFTDDVYDSETGPAAPIELSLHGIGWRLASA